MKKVAILIITLILIGLNAGIVMAEGTTIDYSGSLEVSGINQPHNEDYFLSPTALGTVPVMGSIINLRNDLKIIPNDDVTIKLHISYLNDTTTNLNGTFTLSRGFIDFTPNTWLSLRAGKQRLAWGTGYAWNPANILDNQRNAFTNADDPEGVIAFRNDLNFGPITTQVIITPKQSWETSGRALRIKASPGGFDFSLGSAQNGLDPAAITGDFACSLSGLGLHGEVLYQSGANTYTGAKNILNYLLGADYNLPGGYYLAVEYYHNDTVFQDINALKIYIATHFILPGDIDNLNNLLITLSNNGGATQNHFFLRGSKTFGEAFNLELMLIYNPDDHSLVGQPKFEYIWKQNTSLYIKGLLAAGDPNSEANILPTKTRFDLGMKVSF
jgi:hypothetical protein